jgi:hypothetical protein
MASKIHLELFKKRSQHDDRIANGNQRQNGETIRVLSLCFLIKNLRFHLRNGHLLFDLFTYFIKK